MKVGIARISKIANGDGESARIRASGALEDRFLRPAAGAANAAKLQDADGPVHDEVRTARAERRISLKRSARFSQEWAASASRDGTRMLPRKARSNPDRMSSTFLARVVPSASSLSSGISV